MLDEQVLKALITSGEAAPSGSPGDGRRLRGWLLELGLSALAVLCLGFFVVRAALGYLESHRPVLLLLILTESLTVALVATARSPKSRSLNPLEIVTAVTATYYFLLFDVLGDGHALLRDPLPELLQGLGLGLQAYAKLTLGRSFGLLPANRGIVDSGPYRWVRHPIYLSYLLGHVGFLLGFFSWRNLLVMVSLYALQIARMLMEERTLLRDPAYAAYAGRVRRHFIPFLF